MRIALFSDLHANIAAFESCLAHAQLQGYDRVFILGDLVGYGPSPVELVDRCRQLERAGAVVLRGNHDEVSRVSKEDLARGHAQLMVADWTFEQLDQNARAWLSQLPLSHAFDHMSFVHGTMDDPAAWYYASDPIRVERSLEAAHARDSSRVVFCGHVHEQQLFYRGAGRQFMPFRPTPGVTIRLSPARSWLATVGSVGQPRDGDPRANYAMIDTQLRSLTFFRVPYEVEKTVQLIHQKGLPLALASRLERGL